MEETKELRQAFSIARLKQSSSMFTKLRGSANISEAEMESAAKRAVANAENLYAEDATAEHAPLPPASKPSLESARQRKRKQLVSRAFRS